jgi:hypothetical protein
MTQRRNSIDEIIKGLELAPIMSATSNASIGTTITAFPPLPPIPGPSELSAGIDRPPFDFEKALSAGKALAAAGNLDGRYGWRNLWLFPLTHEARQHPEIEHKLKSLHDDVAAVSAVAAVSRGVRGAGGWSAENDVQWVNAVQRSPANPRTMGSTYDAAVAIGWIPPVTSAGNTGVAIMAPSAALANAGLRPLPPIPGGHYSEAAGLRLFLERYAFVREGGTASYFVCDAEGRLVRTDETSIEAELRNVYVWTGGTGDGDGRARKPLFSWWKRTTSRPQICVAVFKAHGGVAAHEFNMWQGWGVRPMPGRSQMRRLLHHIWQIICRRDRRKFRYLMSWLAWTLQNPDRAPGVAVVLQSSREGAGKSTLSEVMVKIFGVHGTVVETPDGLLGKHNDNLEFACFVAVEEAVFAGDKKAADQLKSRITSSSTTIEPKFKSRRSAPNRLHAMITTNHAWAAPAGDGARRWFVLSIGEEKVDDTSWFGPLYADLESGGYGQFLRLLLDLNLGHWSPRQLEKTDELFEQQIMSASWTKQWLLTSAEQDELVGEPMTPKLLLGVSHQVDVAYRSYCDWVKSSGRTPDSLPYFRKEVVDVLGGKTVRPSGGAYGVRVRLRYFPDGPALRRMVLRSLNIPEDYRRDE